MQATFKLKLWPQPSCADPPAQPDAATLPELEPAHLLEGPLVTFRVTQAMLNTGVVEMPAGHVVKVPEHLCEAPAIRVQVQFAQGNTHTIVFTAQPRSEAQQAPVGATPGDAPAADVPAPVEAPGDVAAVPSVPPAVSASPGAFPSSSPALPSTSAMTSPALPSPGPMSAGGSIPSPSALPPHGGGPPFTPGKGPLFPTDSGAAPGPLPSELRGWHISGLAEVLQTVGCNVADELCIEKCVLGFYSFPFFIHRASLLPAAECPLQYGLASSDIMSCISCCVAISSEGGTLDLAGQWQPQAPPSCRCTPVSIFVYAMHSSGAVCSIALEGVLWGAGLRRLLCIACRQHICRRCQPQCSLSRRRCQAPLP